MMNSKKKTNEAKEPKGGYYYWHCPNCGKAIDPGENCICGQRIIWKYPLSEEERNGFSLGDFVFSDLYGEFGVIEEFEKDLAKRSFAKVKLPNGLHRYWMIDDIKEIKISEA